MLTPRALQLWNQVRKADAPVMVNRRGESADLTLYGIVGQDFTDQAVAEALGQLRDAKSLSLYISSPGGDYFQGKAIYAQVARFAQSHPVTAYVDSLAASAASLIMMAAPRAEVAPEATLMVHEVHCSAFGRAQDLEEQAKVVRSENANLVAIYAKRTGLDAQRVASMLAAETYLTAQQAVDFHFADGIVGQKPVVQAQRKRIQNLRIKELLASERFAPGQPGMK